MRKGSKAVDVDAAMIDQKVVSMVSRRNVDLVERLGARAAGDEHRLKSAAFTALCMQSLLPIDEDAAIDSLTDGSGDAGIDAIHIADAIDGEFVVTVAQSKYSKAHDGLAGYPANAILRIATSIKYIFDPYHDYAFGERLQDHVAEVRSLILDGNIPEIHVLLCNNGQKWAPNGQAEIDGSGLAAHRVSFSHVNHNLLVKVSLRKRAVNARVRLSGKALVDEFVHRRVLVGRLPVTEIKTLFDKEGDALLDRNIRRYLGLSDNRVNSGIHQTLVREASRGDFYFFNNGITAVCSKFTHNAIQSENWDVTVTDFQIVNGGQTCKTVQRTLEERPDQDYSKSHVLFRLYELSPDDDRLIESVTFATNSQNPVGLSDLRSNDEEQERLAVGLKDLGYEYKRKRDDQVSSTADVITSAVAAEAIMAVWRRRPNAAKFRQNKLFGDFYDEVFTADLQPSHVVLSVLIFRLVENERKRPKQKYARKFVPYASHFLAMVVGDLLLERLGLSRNEVTHVNLEQCRQLLYADRASIYEKSAARVDVALGKLGIESNSPLPRIAAQFRRGDLLAQLDKVVKQSAKPTISVAVKPYPPLNEKEQRVLRCLSRKMAYSLGDLATRAFPNERRANSWVRNSLRKLVHHRLAERTAKGTYRAA